jgi:TRAP-type mannitol/chloroaromatic compound transport system permease large subunit
MSGSEKRKKLIGLILPAMVILWILGSIYGGIATVTEAAAIGVFSAMAASAVRGRFS